MLVRSLAETDSPSGGAGGAPLAGGFAPRKVFAERPLILVGFMGTGKSTVGRFLSSRLDREFRDLDAMIIAAAGVSIPEIFRTRGESSFREMESKLLQDALRIPHLVLATGGGAACSTENIALMLEHGIVINLTAPVEELIRRTGNRSGRPLLDATENPEKRVRELLAAREAYYCQAHLRVETVGKSPDDVTREILAWYQQETRQ